MKKKKKRTSYSYPGNVCSLDPATGKTRLARDICRLGEIALFLGFWLRIVFM